MVHTASLLNLSRLTRLSVLAVLGGSACLLVGFAALFGHRYTVGLVLGYGQPYPKAMFIMSSWFITLGLLASVLLLVLIWRRAGPTMRVIAAGAGPTVAWAVLASWVTSFLFYGLRVWSPDTEPTRMRWLVDGPVIHAWRSFARWLLGLGGLVGPQEPTIIQDGGSPMGAEFLVIGAINESMLAMLVTVASLLVVQQVAIVVQRWKHTA